VDDGEGGAPEQSDGAAGGCGGTPPGLLGRPGGAELSAGCPDGVRLPRRDERRAGVRHGSGAGTVSVRGRYGCGPAARCPFPRHVHVARRHGACRRSIRPRHPADRCLISRCVRRARRPRTCRRLCPRGRSAARRPRRTRRTSPSRRVVRARFGHVCIDVRAIGLRIRRSQPERGPVRRARDLFGVRMHAVGLYAGDGHLLRRVDPSRMPRGRTWTGAGSMRRWPPRARWELLWEHLPARVRSVVREL